MFRIFFFPLNVAERDVLQFFADEREFGRLAPHLGQVSGGADGFSLECYGCHASLLDPSRLAEPQGRDAAKLQAVHLTRSTPGIKSSSCTESIQRIERRVLRRSQMSETKSRAGAETDPSPSEDDSSDQLCAGSAHHLRAGLERPARSAQELPRPRHLPQDLADRLPGLGRPRRRRPVVVGLRPRRVLPRPARAGQLHLPGASSWPLATAVTVIILSAVLQPDHRALPVRRRRLRGGHQAAGPPRRRGLGQRPAGRLRADHLGVDRLGRGRHLQHAAAQPAPLQAPGRDRRPSCCSSCSTCAASRNPSPPCCRSSCSSSSPTPSSSSAA